MTSSEASLFSNSASPTLERLHQSTALRWGSSASMSTVKTRGGLSRKGHASWSRPLHPPALILSGREKARLAFATLLFALRTEGRQGELCCASPALCRAFACHPYRRTRRQVAQSKAVDGGADGGGGTIARRASVRGLQALGLLRPDVLQVRAGLHTHHPHFEFLCLFLFIRALQGQLWGTIAVGTSLAGTLAQHFTPLICGFSKIAQDACLERAVRGSWKERAVSSRTSICDLLFAQQRRPPQPHLRRFYNDF